VYKKLKKRKMMKRIPDKYKSTVKQLKEGRHKTIDLTGAGNFSFLVCNIYVEFEDFYIMKFAESISKSKKITSLKLVKNKTTDEGAE
jgi:hypothetical protein